MRNLHLVLTAIAIATAGLFAGCDFQSNKMERAQEQIAVTDRDIGITRTEVEEEIQLFRKEMTGKILENNRLITQIKKKIKNHDMSERVPQEAQLIVLESENLEMRRTIDNYSDLSKLNWDTFKKGFTGDMENLDHRLKNFFETTVVVR